MNNILIETIQKRIEEIKQADKKCLYEIANEIGISEYTLYRVLNYYQMSDDAQTKITAYLNGYLTKDEKLEAYRLDNEELKAENARLKGEIKELKKYQYEQEYLDKVIENYKQALQEIKEIITDAESKLHCVCNITDMLVDIEGKISEVLDER